MPAAGIRKILVPAMDGPGMMQWAEALTWQSLGTDDRSKSLTESLQATAEACIALNAVQGG